MCWIILRMRVVGCWGGCGRGRGREQIKVEAGFGHESQIDALLTPLSRPRARGSKPLRALVGND